jgi:hypothetical protein
LVLLQEKASVGPQLQVVCRELDDNATRAVRLFEGIHPHQLTLRPDPESWSIAECLVHLNLFSQAFVPIIQNACTKGAPQSRAPFKMDLLGRVIKFSLEPPAKLKSVTAQRFEPLVTEPLEEILPRFLELQNQLSAAVAASNGFDLNEIKITSPVSTRIRYNLLSCFEIIAAHQRRHLWQAEKVREQLLDHLS